MDDSDLTIGAKRNILCERAKGELIVNMDDDDYYAPDYLQKCVDAINSGADTTGLRSAYFADTANQKFWQYEYKGKQPYVIGSGMMYKKSIWERNKFKDINVGEDMHFLAVAGRIIPHGSINSFYARIHGNNTASHNAVKMFNVLNYAIFEEIFKQ